SSPSSWCPATRMRWRTGWRSSVASERAAHRDRHRLRPPRLVAAAGRPGHPATARLAHRCGSDLPPPPRHARRPLPPVRTLDLGPPSLRRRGRRPVVAAASRRASRDATVPPARGHDLPPVLRALSAVATSARVDAGPPLALLDRMPHVHRYRPLEPSARRPPS